MKIFFEEYQYEREVVSKYIHERYFVPLKRSEKVKIPYVGYYHNSECGDSVFVLPKVFINVLNEDGKDVEKAFGVFNPEEIVDTQDEKNPILGTPYFDDVYNLSTWIYRAISRYIERNDENITELVDVQNVKDSRGKRSQTWIDIILSLVRFSREHRNLFTYIARINSQGNTRIHWTKTISHIQPLLQDETPIYMRFKNKTKSMNFDEELLVLFYSVLEYLHEKYHFRVVRNVNFPIDTRYVARLIETQKGTRLLKSIRKKYFKDELVELWNLLYVFFDKSEQVEAKGKHEEALMIRNFNMVFEDMIDSLLSDDTKAKNNKLADQPDGKIVDHIYRYDSLISSVDDIYYIGDSKYYKRNEIGENSVYKQFTYAKNVIQMNMDLYNKENGEQKAWRERYFDEKTEGYNISPNFFIRGIVKAKNKDEVSLDLDQTHLDLKPEKKENGEVFVEKQAHHKNRLFDRDTLFVQHYSVNFLYVLSAYALNSSNQSTKNEIYKQFRRNILDWLSKHYSFYLLRRKQNRHFTELKDSYFRLLLGKAISYDENSLIVGLEPDDIGAIVKIYDNIKVDFKMVEYDLLNSTEGNTYSGPKLQSVFADMEVFNACKAFGQTITHMGDFTDSERVYLKQLLVDNFSGKYFGMTPGDWEKIVRDYHKPQAYQLPKDNYLRAAEDLQNN